MSLSVLTLNLWNESGPWAQRAARIREWIDALSPDLVGFQEAVRWPEGGEPVAELLSGTGYHLDFVAGSPFWHEGQEQRVGVAGNAVASRWPIREREELQLPHGGDGEKRVALSVTIESPFGAVGFTCTHLNWKFDHGAIRERQVVAVCDLALRRAPREGFPPILVGDFNAEPDSAEIRYATGLHSLADRSICFLDAWRVAGPEGPGHTWSNHNPYARAEHEPDRRIDYVFVGLPRPDGVGQLTQCAIACHDEKDGVWPSDHLGVYAELRTDPAPDPQ